MIKRTEKLPFEINLPPVYKKDIDNITHEVMDMVEAIYPNNFGVIKDFNYGVTRSDALDALQHFLGNSLENFGPYEDAMTIRGSVLFHSHLSMYLNVGLLNLKKCVIQLFIILKKIKLYPSLLLKVLYVRL